MVELTPIHSSIWDCYEDCVHTICHVLDINPVHMFSKAWNFTMLPPEGSFIEWMEQQKQVKVELLKEYMGVEFTSYTYKGVTAIKQLCEQGIPIIVGMDLYDLPWSDYYQKIHAPHACIIVDYDQKKAQFEFVDPTIMKKDIYLPEAMINSVQIYEIMKKTKQTKRLDYKAMVQESLTSFHLYANQGDAFNDMKIYATKVIEEMLNRNVLETHPSNPLDSEILLHILFTSRNRLTYAKWLEHIGQQEKDITIIEASKKMQAVGLKWQNLRMKLMRGIYQNTLLKIQNQVENYILDLEEEERMLYHILEQYSVGKDPVQQSDLESTGECGTVYNCLDLKKHFNHQAFYSKQVHNKKEGFDGEGYFYIDAIEKSEVDDHIICEGQLIKIQPQVYKGIQITASASKGHYIEEVKIVFVDNSTEIISIGFSDWWEMEPLCGEQIAWTGECGKIEQGVLIPKGTVNIFKNTYKLRGGKEVKEILLPHNPNLHIFKIEGILERTVLQQAGSSRAREKMSPDEINYWDEWEENIEDTLKADRDHVIYTNGASIHKVAITFDDAPDKMTTPRILEILKEYDVKATFAVIGYYFEECGDLLKQMKKEGHQIVNHTWYHKHLSECEKEEISGELMKTENAIFSLIGERPLFMRPPYGDFNETVKEAVYEAGLNMVLWSYNTFDWAATCKEDILENMIENIRDGEILLMHSYENKEPTIAALPKLIEELKNKGVEMVTVAELLNVKAYV